MILAYINKKLSSRSDLIGSLILAVVDLIFKLTHRILLSANLGDIVF